MPVLGRCVKPVNGRYFWVPFCAIDAICFQAPASVTDLVWRHALVRLADGTEQVCQIPARYPFADGASDSVRLGRTTEWLPLDDDGVLYEGMGQKAAERAKRKPAAYPEHGDIYLGWCG